MNEESGKKFNKTLEDEIKEIRQMQLDITAGVISDKEVKAKLAELDRNFKEKKKVYNEIMKKVRAEAELKKK